MRELYVLKTRYTRYKILSILLEFSKNNMSSPRAPEFSTDCGENNPKSREGSVYIYAYICVKRWRLTAKEVSQSLTSWRTLFWNFCEM